MVHGARTVGVINEGSKPSGDSKTKLQDARYDQFLKHNPSASYDELASLPGDAVSQCVADEVLRTDVRRCVMIVEVSKRVGSTMDPSAVPTQTVTSSEGYRSTRTAEALPACRHLRPSDAHPESVL